MSSHKRNRWQGLVLGALGGVAGVLAMRQYWKTVQNVTGKDPRTDYEPSEVPDTTSLDSISLVGKHHHQGESTTDAIGRILYQQVTGQEPSDESKTVLSYLIHWLISMVTSGAYGAIRGRTGFLDLPGGLVMGTGLWLFGDELAMPLLGLTKGPTTFPPELHAHSWGAHLAYGLTSAATTQFLYRLF